jgi:hypothetical protein
MLVTNKLMSLRYTAYWNVTYATSIAGKADAQGCPEAPLAVESFIHKASFESE